MDTLPPHISLSGAYRNGITTSLSTIDEMLTNIETVLASSPDNAVFNQSVRRLDKSRRDAIHDAISSIRLTLSLIKHDLNLPTRTSDDVSSISSYCAGMWEILCELETKYLKGYGEIPPGLPAYLDEKVSQLIKATEHISDITNINTAGGAHDI
jgi:hypothetical protein